MNPEDIIQKYRKIGYAQILPALVCLGITILMSFFAIYFTYTPMLYRRQTDPLNPSTAHFIRLGIILLILSFFIFGLISFLIASYRFIKSKKHSDYELLAKGMIHLNRGWVILLAFSVIMVSISCYALYSTVAYGYF